MEFRVTGEFGEGCDWSAVGAGMSLSCVGEWVCLDAYQTRLATDVGGTDSLGFGYRFFGFLGCFFGNFRCF
jgi:hypothetical protein